MNLYNKYRPQTFSDVVAHEVVMKAINTQLVSDKFSHAYIMAGQRGTGKTTTAKLMARYLACENPSSGEPCNNCSSCKAALDGAHPDIFEIDGASNNGVANIRDIKTELAYPPIQSKYKVYIIDEVHMLSINAFNALLTTIEEPNANVVFIFATTEIHKIPATIRSRCQIFTFAQIDVHSITNRLMTVAEKESIGLVEDAAKLIAENADGSIRDALSILSQVSHNKIVTDSVVLESLGLIDNKVTEEFINTLLSKNVSKIMTGYNQILAMGKTISQLIESIIKYLASEISKGNNVEVYSDVLTSLLQFRREVSKENNVKLLFNLFIVEYATKNKVIEDVRNVNVEAEPSRYDDIIRRIEIIEGFLRTAFNRKSRKVNNSVVEESSTPIVNEVVEQNLTKKEPVNCEVEVKEEITEEVTEEVKEEIKEIAKKSMETAKNKKLAEIERLDAVSEKISTKQKGSSIDDMLSKLKAFSF